jgi:hypothetical protein
MNGNHKPYPRTFILHVEYRLLRAASKHFENTKSVPSFAHLFYAKDVLREGEQLMSLYIQQLNVKAHERELHAEARAYQLAKLATAHERPRLRLTFLAALRRPRRVARETWQPSADPATT